MDLQQLVYIVIAPAAAVFLVLLLGRMGPVLGDARNRAFAALVIADIGWLAANWVEALWSTRQGTYVFMRIAYLFIAALPVAWLDYAIRLTGKSRGRASRRLVALSIIPLITQVMVWTNESHWLMWTELRFSSVLGLPFITTYSGPWFWIHAVYSYILIMTGAIKVIDAYRDLSPFLKGQGRLTLVAVLIPLLYNVLFVTKLIPVLEKDYTAITFALSATLFAFASERYGMFAVVPVARSALLDSLSSAIFVVNDRGLVLDANAAGIGLTGGSTPVGRFAEEFAPLSMVARSLDRKGTWNADVALDGPAGPRRYELSCVPVTDPKGRLLCRLVSLNDVTQRYTQAGIPAGQPASAMPAGTPDANLPLCSACGKARDGSGAWVPLPRALEDRFGIRVTQGMCPDCLPRRSGDGKRG